MGAYDVLNKKFLIVAIAVVLFLGMAGSVQEVDAQAVPENVFSIDSFSPILYKINPNTGATISSVVIILEGTPINGGAGLAFNPADGKLYALLKVGGNDRLLVTIDPITGIATEIGDTGDRFAALAFNSGTLFGVTTNRSTVDSTLFTISTADGSVTQVCELDNGLFEGGRALAFRPTDGLLYHAFDGSFERIDDTSVDPCGVTDIPLSNTNLFPTGLVFRQATNEFLFVEGFSFTLFSVNPGGGVTFIGDMSHHSRGLAIITGVNIIQNPPSVSPDPGNVLSIDSFSPILYQINPDTGATISAVVISLAGETVNGGRGLAFNPADGKLYAFLKVDGDTFLVTLDPATGVATERGDTEDRFAAMAFNSGTLFAFDTSEDLHSMSTADASTTFLCELSDRGSLAFLPTDGLLYHAFDGSFERIDDTSVDPCDVTDIPLSNTNLEPTGLVFRQATNEFLLADRDKELYTVSANPGEVTFIGDMSHQSRGLAIITEFIPPPPPLPGENIFSIASFSPVLHKINPNTGATISSVVITLTGETVNGGAGLAFNPADEKLYALLKVGGNDRLLVTLDPATGVATLIGDTEDRFAAMAFNSGTLFAFDTSEDLHSISTADASTIFLCELSDRGSLAFLPTDGLLYHAFDGSFERIDDTSVDPCDVTDIPLSNTNLEPTGLVFRQATNEFLLVDRSVDLYTISANPGEVTFKGDMSHQSRGLAIITGVNIIQNLPGLPPGEHVLSIDSSGPLLHKINPDTGATISAVVITLDGSFSANLNVNGGTGIAVNPADGKLYALLKISGGIPCGRDGGVCLDRHLATIDPQTGIATLVGDTGVFKLAGLTFNSGTLFGMTPSRAAVSDTLFTISTADGSVTEVCELDSGRGDLAFLPTDGLLYHAFSGSLERIDDTSVDPCDVTDIPLSNTNLSATGLVFRQATNEFLLADSSSDLYTISANPGEVTFIGDMSHQSRGLAIITVSGGGGGGGHGNPTIGVDDKGILVVTCGVAFDGKCFTITAPFHEEFKLYEMMSGTHTISITMFCANGVTTCNYAAIGIMPYSESMDNTTWKIELYKDFEGNLTIVTTDPEGFLGEMTVTTQILDDEFWLVSFTVDFKNKDTGPMMFGVQVRDNYKAVRNWYLNEGVEFKDSDAYPSIVTEFEEYLKVDSLCLNEDPTYRYSCAFAEIRERAIQNAEETLSQMYNNEYQYK